MIVWSVLLAVIVCMLASVVYDQRRKRSRSVEEFERDVRSGAGGSGAVLRGAFGELDKAFAPSQAVIAETLETERRRSDAAGEGDDVGRPRGR